MMLTPQPQEIPLGVECAWPFRAEVSQLRSSPVRRHRLAEAWRRTWAVLCSPRRRGWTG